MFSNKKQEKEKAAVPAKARKPHGKLNPLSIALDESVWEHVSVDFKDNTKFTETDANGRIVYYGLLFDTRDVGGMVGGEANKDESKGTIIEAIRQGKLLCYNRADLLADETICIIPEENTLYLMNDYSLFDDVKFIFCRVDAYGTIISIPVNDAPGADDIRVTLKEVIAFMKDDTKTIKDFYTSKFVEKKEEHKEESEAEKPDDSDGNAKADAGKAEPGADDDWNSDNETFADFDDYDEYGEESAGEELPEDEMMPVPDDVPDFPIDFDDPTFEDGEADSDDENDKEDAEEEKDGFDNNAFGDDSGDDSGDDGKEGEDMDSGDNDLTDEDNEAEPDAGNRNDSIYKVTYSGNYEDDETDPYAEDDGHQEEQPVQEEYEEPEINEKFLNDHIFQLYYEGDLDLKLSARPFEARFIKNNEYIPFDPSRIDFALKVDSEDLTPELRRISLHNEALNRIIKDENTRLRRYDADLKRRFKNKYLSMMQKNVENIAALLDYQDAGTTFGKINRMIEQRRDDELNDLESSTREQQDKLERLWQEKLESIGEAAKRTAIETHKQQFGSQHEHDKNDINIQQREIINSNYLVNLETMHNDRRYQAKRLFEVAVGKTLDRLQEAYEEALKGEIAELGKAQDRINRFLNQTREEELTRIKVLEEEHRVRLKVNELHSKYVSQIKAISTEHEAKTKALEREVADLNRQNESLIAGYEKRYKDKVAEGDERAANLERQLKDLTDRYCTLDEKKEAEYGARIAALERERDVWKSELDNLAEAHRKTGKISTFLLIAILIASLAIGFIIGSFVSSKKDTGNDVKTEQDVSEVSGGAGSDIQTDITLSEE